MAAVDPTGAYTVRDLPAGTLRLRIASTDTTITAVTIDSVYTNPGAVTEVPLAGWRFSKRLIVDTSPAGANVAETVLNFPLLVRLDTARLDFSQASDSGQDIRFTKPDGSPLPYEIEQWDRSNHLASIWVLMDTVYGNDSSQYVVMLYGNSSASPASNGAAVFDTTNGFSGVWHLSEEASDTGSPDLHRDATANRFHGSDHLSSTQREGVIGFGHGFDSTRMDYINLGTDRNFVGGASAVTLEAWVKLSAGGSAGGTVIAHSVSAATVSSTSHAYLLAHTRTRVGGRCLEADPEQAITTDTVLATATWYQVTGVIDYQRDSLYLFVNGETVMAGAVGFSMPSLPAGGSTSSSIGSGEYPFSDFFNGSMDEVRTQRVRRSAAWIKLCYENQKPGSNVVGHSMP